MRSHWTEIEKYLEDQKVAQELIGELRDFHMRYEVEDQVKERVEKTGYPILWEKRFWKCQQQRFFREIICYFPVQKLQEKCTM